jgi:hypothetical protein
MTEKVRDKEGKMGHRERNETKKGKWGIEKELKQRKGNGT